MSQTEEKKRKSRSATTQHSSVDEEPVSKRVLQNRKAQKDFRSRRAAYLKELEAKVREYEARDANAGPVPSYADLKLRCDDLERENAHLRELIYAFQSQPNYHPIPHHEFHPPVSHNIPTDYHVGSPGPSHLISPTHFTNTSQHFGHWSLSPTPPPASGRRVYLPPPQGPLLASPPHSAPSSHSFMRTAMAVDNAKEIGEEPGYNARDESCYPQSPDNKD